MRHGVTLGYEALTRFTDGTPPDVMFARATRAGLGPELEAAAIAAALEAAGPLPANRFLDLNVSPALILAREPLRSLLRATGFGVILEVTEHDRIEDYPALRRGVEALGANVRLAVDDAGAGFASLRHILELRPALVKLDQGLIRGVDADPVRQALVAGMAHFAGRLETQLAAEGVETELERSTLLTLGITLGQGYLFGRPVPVAELAS
jgi:EAL domain-containing protein (putative c-di-GMP-specific phosphodiesterase class I)